MQKISPLAIVTGLSVVAALTAGVLYTQRGVQVSQLTESNAYLQAEMQRQPAPAPRAGEEVGQSATASTKFYSKCYAEPTEDGYDTSLKCIDGTGTTVTVLSSINSMLGQSELQATTVFLVPGTDLVYVGYHIVETDADSFQQHAVYNLKTAAKSQVDLTGIPKEIEWLLPEVHLSPDGRRAVIAGASLGSGDAPLDIKHLFVIDLVTLKVVATIPAPAGTSFTMNMDFRILEPSIHWEGANKLGYAVYAPPKSQKDSMGNLEFVAGDILREETYKLP